MGGAEVEVENEYERGVLLNLDGAVQILQVYS